MKIHNLASLGVLLFAILFPVIEPQNQLQIGSSLVDSGSPARRVDPETIRQARINPSQSFATVDPLVFLSSIETGGRPDALAIDTCRTPSEVLLYDRLTSNVRFLNSVALTLFPDLVNLPTWNDKKWIAFDRSLCLAYVATTRAQYNFGTIYWEETRLHILDSRVVTATVSVNESYNRGLPSPADTKYSIEGLALKQSNSEADNPARLILDNTRKGRIDVVDLSATGTAVARSQRFAYDERSPEYSNINLGNSLALESKHETLSVDDLATTDILYISDRNHPYVGGYGYLRVIQLNHPMADLNAVLLPEVNLNSTWPFPNGLQGLDIAGQRDLVYIASGLQSFDNGYLGRLSTTNHASLQAGTILYGDMGKVLVDWYDTRRVFIASFDGFYNDPNQGLYLHLVYDATVIDTLLLKEDYTPSVILPYSMAFDPYTRRLYMAVGSQILVVQVNYGLPPPLIVIENPLYLPMIGK
jgi:hypothetical protein